MIFDESNFPTFPPNWGYMLVDDACENVSVREKVQQKVYEPSGSVPVVDQGSRLIGGYISDESKVMDTALPVVVFGDHTRALKFIDFRFAAGADGIKVLHPHSCYDPRMFYRFVQAIRLPDKGYARHFQHLRSSKIPLPPLSEQVRIRAALDSLLTKTDACRKRLDEVQKTLKKFRDTVLEAAVSGRLTEEWRVDHRLTLDWVPTKLSQIGELGRGKSKHRPRNDPQLYGGAHPFIQTGDVAQSGGLIIKHQQTYNDFGLAQSRMWPGHTLCITIAANIADTAILTYPACFPDSVVGFIADQAKCSPWFVKWSIDVRRGDLESLAPATAQKNINLAVLNDIEILLPSPAEQLEIVRRVKDLLELADSLKRRYDQASSRVDKLTPSLLAKAFRGELVPQDPNDEPAEDLLTRIGQAK